MELLPMFMWLEDHQIEVNTGMQTYFPLFSPSCPYVSCQLTQLKQIETLVFNHI